MLITGTNLAWATRVTFGQAESGHGVTGDSVIETTAPAGADIHDVTVMGAPGYPTPIVTAVEIAGPSAGDTRPPK
jgi:hypothetical protein